MSNESMEVEITNQLGVDIDVTEFGSLHTLLNYIGDGLHRIADAIEKNNNNTNK